VAVDTRSSIRQDLRRLKQAVEDAVEADSSSLGEIHSVLVNAQQAVQALRSDGETGAYVVPIPAERMREYFPVTDWPGRDPTPDQMAAANARWEAALERGRQHRKEALEQLGPVLTSRQVAERLGVSTVTVNDWRRRGKLLAVRFHHHQYVYPIFQFAAIPSRGEQGVLRHLEEILNLLPTASAWAKAQFFLTKAPFLGGRTPLVMLRSGKRRDIERVRMLAPHMGEMGS